MYNGDIKTNIKADVRSEKAIQADERMIQIFWNDLTESKQKEILEAFGSNCNYDVFPIVELAVPDEK